MEYSGQVEPIEEEGPPSADDWVTTESSSCGAARYKAGAAASGHRRSEPGRRPSDREDARNGRVNRNKLKLRIERGPEKEAR